MLLFIRAAFKYILEFTFRPKNFLVFLSQSFKIAFDPELFRLFSPSFQLSFPIMSRSE